MPKFKVGDKVRIVDKWQGMLQNHYGEMDKWLGKVMTVREVDGATYRMEEDRGEAWGGWHWFDEMIAGPACNKKIVITTDGKVTLARLYDGKAVVKSAEAKCAPNDTFDFNVGAQLAFDRLMAADKPEPAPEKAGTMQVYCVKGYEPGVWLTEGKVYEVIDGRITFDDGWNCTYNDVPISDDPNTALTKLCVPLVKRPAQVGEWVLYEDEICEVIAGSTARGSASVYVRTQKGDQTYHGSNADRPIKRPFTFLEPRNYLVLDGYQPEPEKPKYYSGKVVCVEADERYWHEDHHPKVGHVYDVKDGRFVYADGSTTHQIYTDIPGKEESFVRAKFIEFRG